MRRKAILELPAFCNVNNQSATTIAMVAVTFRVAQLSLYAIFTLYLIHTQEEVAVVLQCDSSRCEYLFSSLRSRSAEPGALIPCITICLL